MFRFMKCLFCAGALAASVLLGTASPARADLELQLISGSSIPTTVDSKSNDGPAVFNGTVGVFNVCWSAGASNSPGGTAALACEGALSITNTSGSNATITIEVSAQGFTSPTSPPPLLLGDLVAGTVTGKGTTVSGIAEGYADATNTLFGEGFSDSGLDLTIPKTTSGNTFSVTGTAVNPNGFSPNQHAYSLTFVETFTLSAGATLSLTGGGIKTEGNVDPPNPLPEPATLTAAFTAMLFLGFGAWRRRGRNQGGEV